MGHRVRSKHVHIYVHHSFICVDVVVCRRWLCTPQGGVHVSLLMKFVNSDFGRILVYSAYERVYAKRERFSNQYSRLEIATGCNPTNPLQIGLHCSSKQKVNTRTSPPPPLQRSALPCRQCTWGQAYRLVYWTRKATQCT